jgi:hypothetical protein
MKKKKENHLNLKNKTKQKERKMFKLNSILILLLITSLNAKNGYQICSDPSEDELEKLYTDYEAEEFLKKPTDYTSHLVVGSVEEFPNAFSSNIKDCTNTSIHYYKNSVRGDLVCPSIEYRDTKRNDRYPWILKYKKCACKDCQFRYNIKVHEMAKCLPYYKEKLVLVRGQCNDGLKYEWIPKYERIVESCGCDTVTDVINAIQN